MLDSVLTFITINLALGAIYFGVFISYLKEKNNFTCKSCKEEKIKRGLKPPPPPPRR